MDLQLYLTNTNRDPSLRPDSRTEAIPEEEFPVSVLFKVSLSLIHSPYVIIYFLPVEKGQTFPV